MVLTVLSGNSAKALPRFGWQNPTAHPRVMLYADPSISEALDEHPDWFERDFLVAGLYGNYDQYGESDKAIKQVFDAREKLFNRRIYAGTAISGTTAVGEFSLRQYPAPAVSIEDLSVKTKYLGKWLREPSQVVVDLSDKASREDLQSEIRLIWLHSVSRIRFIENAAVHPRVAALQKWSDYCDNMEGLGRIAESLKANVIFSIFMRPWEVNDKEMKQLISGVGAYNAIAMQIPWSKSIKEDTNAKNWAIYRYRQILDSNIVVILVPSDDAPIAELTKWVSTWRRPTDMIFYSQSSRSEPLV